MAIAACRLRALLVTLAACSSPAAIVELPITPVGYDAYLHLEQLPQIHLGDRTYMRSTYDRSGGNEGADASHFLRQDGGNFAALDVTGPGMLVFARANHWHGSPWHWTVDGTDHVISESSTATPNAPVTNSIYLPADALPSPLAVTWSTTKGADLEWVPVPFARSLAIAYERTHYGTGYFIFHAYADATDHLSRPISAWDESPPPSEVLDVLNSAGTDIAPGTDHDAIIDVPASGTVDALALDGAFTIRRLAIDAPAAVAAALERVHLVIAWDDRTPSVDAPLGLLFGAGTFYDRSGRGAIVKALVANVSIDPSGVHAALYFPMPFFANAHIQLEGAGTAIAGVHVSARVVANDATAQWQGYFHATHVDHGVPTAGQDLVLLDTRTVEDNVDWCGKFVGTAFTFSDRAELSTLEGDPRFFFDDAESPQAHGTGTEEWGGGGDYWGGQTMTLPLAGHPTGAPSLAQAQNTEDAIESAYRFLIADAMPFGKNARIQLEHGGTDTSTEHYETVTFWYGRPNACLVLDDTLQIGDADSEASHAYASPTASAPTSVSSQWDGLGVDDPVSSDLARVTTGTSAFTLALDPNNHGVLLRRKLDYSIADQASEVWVDGALAGVWYTAGSTSCIYSNPPGELDPAQPIVETSTRAWRDDEMLIPRALTEGRSSINIQLRPVAPATSRPWSEVRYQLYSYVL